MASYTNWPLYGGAILADIPKGFADVSSFREVPDHQEVFISRTGPISIIVDLNHRVEESSDADALTYHFCDIVDATYGRIEWGPPGTQENSGHSRVWFRKRVLVDSLPDEAAVYTLLGTTLPSMVPQISSSLPQLPPVDFFAILLVLIRLPAQKCDITVTINVPHAPGQYDVNDVDLESGKWGPLINTALEYRDRILRTLKIEDWNLFSLEQSTEAS